MNLNDLFRVVPSSDDEDLEYTMVKSLVTSSWSEVSDPIKSLTWFHTLGTGISHHVATCRNFACRISIGGPVRFCTPQVFVLALESRLQEYAENLDVAGVMDLWRTKEPKKIDIDPRYIAFRCGYDFGLLNFAVTKQVIHDPYEMIEEKLD